MRDYLFIAAFAVAAFVFVIEPAASALFAPLQEAASAMESAK